MKYPKINTLWKRGDKGKITSEYSMPEFNSIKLFEVFEKVNGRNTRITYNKEKLTVRFDGRNDNSDIPSTLVEYLTNTFPLHKLFSTFPGTKEVILFGEGYGSNMSKGSGLYRSDVSFALFDVYIDGWWLKRSDIRDIANKLSISTVPYIGLMPIDKIIKYIKSKPYSIIANERYVPIEGIVAKSHPQMLFRKDHNQIMFKLKVKYYEW